jgi:hypothetical protein
MAKKCPIYWTKEDGPHPCAFKNAAEDCAKTNDHSLASECIPMYMPRYLESIKPIMVKCAGCGVNKAMTTIGKFKRGILPLCPICSKKRQADEALAAHVRGDI